MILIIPYDFSSFSYLLHFGAHFAKMEERKKIVAALLISYSAYMNYLNHLLDTLFFNI